MTASPGVARDTLVDLLHRLVVDWAARVRRVVTAPRCSRALFNRNGDSR